MPITSQIKSVLADNARHAGLTVSDEHLTALAQIAEARLNAATPATVTETGPLVDAIKEYLVVDAEIHNLRVSDATLTDIASAFAVYLTANGLVPEADPEVLIPEVDPEGLQRLGEIAAEFQAQQARPIDTDEAYEVIRQVLSHGAEDNEINLKAKNLNDLTDLVLGFLTERGLLS